MTAIGTPGRSSAKEREESYAFSRRLLAEYDSSDVTYLQLAAKHGCSESMIYTRCAWARRNSK